MDKAQLPGLAKLGVDMSIIIWNRYCDIFPKLVRSRVPSVRLNNRLKTCGGRIFTETRECELSSEMFYYNQKEYFDIIIPHELAHQVDWDLFKGSGHRASWKGVMVAYGIPPDTYHNLINPLHEKRKQARIR